MKKTIKIICMFLFVASLGFAQSGTSKTKAACKEVDKTFFQKMNNIDGLLTEKGLKATRFKVTITAKGKAVPIEIENEANAMNEKAKAALSNLDSGTKIYFEYIMAKDKDGKDLKLEPLNYSIK